MTKAAELAKMGEVLTNSQIGGRRNLLINSGFEVAQRGTSASSVTASQYLCDRWEYETIGEETVTISQTTDVPSGFSNSFKVEITTADSSVTSTDYAVVKQVIEAQNLQHLKYGSSDAETITLSFHVKSSVTGTYAVGLEHGETGSYHSQTYSISSANTWEKKTVTFTGNTATAINNDNGAGLHVNFALSAGTDYTSGSNGAWGVIANWLANHAVNVIGTVNATFFITGVQLEIGSQATPFEHRSFGEELALCQRYFQRLATISTFGPIGIGRAWSTSRMNISYPLKVTMRDNPSLSVSDFGHMQVAGISQNLDAIHNDGNSGTTVATDKECTGIKIGFGHASAAFTTGTIYQAEFDDAAEGYIDISSEL
jgi:hypothetical protein